MAEVNTYNVIAQREGGAWTATVTDADGAHTWGRGLRHLEQSVREAIALAEDLDDHDGFDLHWTFVTGDPDMDQESAQLRNRRDRAEREAEELVAATSALVGHLRSRGFSVRDAAAIAGISPARAGQLSATA